MKHIPPPSPSDTPLNNISLDAALNALLHRDVRAPADDVSAPVSASPKEDAAEKSEGSELSRSDLLKQMLIPGMSSETSRDVTQSRDVTLEQPSGSNLLEMLSKSLQQQSISEKTDQVEPKPAQKAKTELKVETQPKSEKSKSAPKKRSLGINFGARPKQ